MDWSSSSEPHVAISENSTLSSSDPGDLSSNSGEIAQNYPDRLSNASPSNPDTNGSSPNPNILFYGENFTCSFLSRVFYFPA
jgi:hypothetical protein